MKSILILSTFIFPFTSILFVILTEISFASITLTDISDNINSSALTPIENILLFRDISLSKRIIFVDNLLSRVFHLSLISKIYLVDIEISAEDDFIVSDSYIVIKSTISLKFTLLPIISIFDPSYGNLYFCIYYLTFQMKVISFY